SCQKRDNINVYAVPDRGFMSNRPANSWEEALVSGNGIMGAMVMGFPGSDTIIVNHALLYLPLNEPLKPVSQGLHLDTIRTMMLKREYCQASRYVVDLSQQENYGAKRWTDPFIPAFDLIIEMEKDYIKDYARSVNFETGEVEVKWSGRKGTFLRSTFVSRKDNLIVTRIKAGGIRINCRIGMRKRFQESWWSTVDVRKSSGFKEEQIRLLKNAITYRVEFSNQWAGMIAGYDGGTLLLNKGGRLIAGEKEIEVNNADELLLITWVDPFLNDSLPDYNNRLNLIKNQHFNYDTLLKRHSVIHGELFNRTKLNLGGEPARKTIAVEELWSGTGADPEPAMVELAFDAARYNILSATGINPPNLQGIWGGTLTPPWSGDFTMNGNLPMAVSGMLSAGMPELMCSLFNLLERFMDDFQINAKEMFQCKGIHIPSRISSHGLNNHFDATWPMTFWTGGAGWYSMFYYDYFLVTGDTAFLKKRAIPFMEKAIAFYEDFLIVGENGKYIFNPSYSPENNPANIPCQACINATMDVMIAKQLIRNIITASETAGVNSEKIETWRTMLEKMPSYELNSKGDLREWMWPDVEENHRHRHVSHLFALFDLMDPEFKNNPELLEGAVRVIKERMKVRRLDNGGEMAFGLAQLGFAAAMTGDAETCHEILGWITRKYWNNNMVTTHDPGAIFNLDLSGGYPAFIIKMLVYSEPGLVSLLPALPIEISSGDIEGVLLRGQMEIKQLSWEGNQAELEIYSGTNKDFILRLPGAITSISGTGITIEPYTSDCTRRLTIKKETTALIHIAFDRVQSSDTQHD
ncbi:MAG: glycoside hydrolase N-terminal domain-containing protein, partial [Bacteroidales bacterium]|nr:glycoside hydrolase N-terminal domain-containing protein [Bacteroidales bacterium]